MQPATTNLLQDKAVLVIEDEYYLADDVVNGLRDAGAEVVGPAGDVDRATRLIKSRAIDCAIVDVNLAGTMAYPLLTVLKDRKIPFVIASGYSEAVLPPEWQAAPRLEKPYHTERLIELLQDVLEKSKG